MSHDPHEHLAYLAKVFGTDDPFTRDQLSLQQFTRYNWHERQDIIEKTSAAIGAEDGASLRKKSQLADFHKKLKTADGLLRKAGR